MIKNNTTSKVGYGKRFTVLVALGAVAMAAIGLVGFNQAQQDLRIEALEAYTTTLVDHSDYAREQSHIVNSLMQEGVTSMRGAAKATAGLVKLAAKKQLPVKGAVAPALTDGTKALTDNVKFGQKTAGATTDPKKLEKTFKQSADFNAEISLIFPKSYTVVKKLRQDLKVHQFTLSNLVKDVALLASSTKSNLRRSIRKLDLRAKYEGTDKLTPEMDVKIWKYEIKS